MIKKFWEGKKPKPQTTVVSNFKNTYSLAERVERRASLK
jgi:hypothetical protein